MKLTEPQLRHLRATAEQGPYWTPQGSAEHRCADALLRKGLLTRHLEQWGTVYEINDAGRAALPRKLSDPKEDR